MDRFYSTSGSSPPEGRRDHPAQHDLEEQEGLRPLPEELVEALAGLLAQALVNDIRQYPVPPGGSLATASSDGRPTHAARK